MEHSLFLQAFSEFRKYCATISPLPSELHIKLSDIINGYGTATDLFPFFLQHAKVVSQIRILGVLNLTRNLKRDKI